MQDGSFKRFLVINRDRYVVLHVVEVELGGQVFAPRSVRRSLHHVCEAQRQRSQQKPLRVVLVEHFDRELLLLLLLLVGMLCASCRHTSFTIEHQIFGFFNLYY